MTFQQGDRRDGVDEELAGGTGVEDQSSPGVGKKGKLERELAVRTADAPLPPLKEARMLARFNQIYDCRSVQPVAVRKPILARSLTKQLVTLAAAIVKGLRLDES